MVVIVVWKEGGGGGWEGFLSVWKFFAFDLLSHQQNWLDSISKVIHTEVYFSGKWLSAFHIIYFIRAIQ